MSAAFLNEIRHLRAQCDYLQNVIDELTERVLVLEANDDNRSVELDTDSLEPKRRGRPRKQQ